MNDFVWILHAIRNRQYADAATQPYIDEFDADPDAFDAKYRVLYPREEGAIDMLRADTNTEL